MLDVAIRVFSGGMSRELTAKMSQQKNNLLLPEGYGRGGVCHGDLGEARKQNIKSGVIGPITISKLSKYTIILKIKILDKITHFNNLKKQGKINKIIFSRLRKIKFLNKFSDKLRSTNREAAGLAVFGDKKKEGIPTKGPNSFFQDNIGQCIMALSHVNIVRIKENGVIGIKYHRRRHYSILKTLARTGQRTNLRSTRG